MDWRRRGAWLLHPDGCRAAAHGPGLRHHSHAGSARVVAVLAGREGRAAGGAMACIAAARAGRGRAVTALPVEVLTEYATRLMRAAGLDGDKPETVARLLV